MPSRIVGGPANVAPQLIRPGDVQVQDSTFSQASNFLVKLGERYANGKLAEKQQQMFVDGMQRVATGEALSDIKQDQPAFASIFGDTASIQGAQAMAKVKAVDDFTTQAYGQMPDLAKMDPKKAGRVLAQGMQQHLTGDPAVDAVVQQRMVEQLPVLMKAQVKANYAYTQNEMSRQYSGAISSASQTMQTAAVQLARGAISQEDFDVNRSNAVSMLQKPAGMADETYKKTMMETAQLQLAQGNHWFDRTLRTRGPNGEPSFYETVLDADDQKKLIEARRTAEMNTAKQYGFNQYGSVIAELAGRAPGMAPAEIQKAVLQINQQYMAETGSEQGIIDMGDAQQMVKGSYSRSFALQDKAAELRMSQRLKDQSDALKQQATIQKAITMFNYGNGAFTSTQAGVPKDEADSVFYEGFQIKEQKDPNEAARYVVDNYTKGAAYKNPMIENVLLAPIRQAEAGAPTGESMAKAVTLYANMLKQKGGQGAVDSYLGVEGTQRMEDYLAAIREGQDTREATAFAFSRPVLKGDRLDTEENLPVLQKVLKDEYKSGGANGLFQTDMYPASQRTLEATVAPIAQKFMARGMPREAAIKRALPMARERYDVLGPLVVTKSANEPTLAQVVETSAEDAGKLAAKVIQRKAWEQGVNADILSVFDRPANDTESGVFTGKFSVYNSLFNRGEVSATKLKDTVDSQGRPLQTYHTTVSMPDGSYASFYFSSDDIRKELEEEVKPKR